MSEPTASLSAFHLSLRTGRCLAETFAKPLEDLGPSVSRKFVSHFALPILVIPGPEKFTFNVNLDESDEAIFRRH